MAKAQKKDAEVMPASSLTSENPNVAKRQKRRPNCPAL